MSDETKVLDEEITTEVEEVYDEPEYTGGGVGKVLAGVAVLTCAGVGALAYKFRHKIAERRDAKNIAKLEKKGYVILKADEVEIREVEVDADEEAAE